MRIGIDGGCLANRRGFGRFARQVVEALGASDTRHEFVLIVDRPSIGTLTVPSGFETVAAEVREAPSLAASASGRRSVRDLLAMGRAAARARLDLMYFPASYSFFPVWNVGKTVVTLHDTMALAHPDLIFPSRLGRLAWWVKEQAAVRWADRVVTVSETARRDILGWFRLPGDRVRVVPEGPSSCFVPRDRGARSDAVLARYRIDPSRRFLLYVGGLSPHKNLIRLLQAVEQAGVADVDLVLVGDLGDVFHTHVPELREAVSRLGLERRVNFTGFVPDDDLAELYGRAYALVQPSLAEGFGLPPLEAMACGTPVLASRAGSLPEVVGDAGRFFEPTEVGAIASAIRGLLDDPDLRSTLAARAVERAKVYTWAGAARALLEVFEEVGSAGRTAIGRTQAPMGRSNAKRRVNVSGPGTRAVGRVGR